MLDVDETHWDQIMDTNLKGTFFTSQACARAMATLGDGGAIVNVASLRGVRANKGVAVYAASKAGVISLTTSFAQALAENGIRVNAVAPGVVATEATEQASRGLMRSTTVEQWQEDFKRTIPLQRFGDPDEVADAVVYLASDVSSYVTGTVLAIDGGGYW